MTEPDLRVDPLTGAHVVIRPGRQERPRLPGGPCPFCPGGIEAPAPYQVRWIPNRWPGLPAGRHEVVLHSPDHDASLLSLGPPGVARVAELWSARTAALGARPDVAYVFPFENRGRLVGATIDHPHSQILAFSVVPPVPARELSTGRCELCSRPEPGQLVTQHPAWLACVPWAPSWPYEILIVPHSHIPDLPAAGRRLRGELAAVLLDCLARVEAVLGPAAPYMLWAHQRPADGGPWPTAHLHLHLAPLLRAAGTPRHLSSAELGAGMLFNSVEPASAAARLRQARGASA
jgi:UDPglucose--hexose-1-phosphate uridylyltransferase